MHVTRLFSYNRPMRRIFPLIGIIVLCFSLGWMNRKLFKENGSFSPHRVLPNWHYFPQYPLTATSSPSILNQSFYYLAKGKQSFVFISEDGNWVLKLLRLPRKARGRGFFGKQESLSQLNTTCQAFANGANILKNQTQIVYSHLCPSNIDTASVTLIDRSGYCHILPTRYLPFVIQKKGDPFFSALEHSTTPEVLIDQVFSLFETMYENGFIDHDPIMEKNFGYVDNKPFIIDVGQVSPIEQPIPKRNYLEAMMHSLQLKLESEHPLLFQYYKKKLP